jgi:hypothetical protein
MDVIFVISYFNTFFFLRFFFIGSVWWNHVRGIAFNAIWSVSYFVV